MANRNLRAGDGDRERVAEALRRHFAEGRLDPEEFDDRLTRAYQARTFGDLEDLLVDLPQESGGYGLPVPDSRSLPRQRHRHRDARLAARGASRVWAAWLTTSVICWTIWLLTLVNGDGVSGFWPIWVSVPWGAALLLRSINGANRR